VLDNNPLRNEPGYETIGGPINDTYNMMVEHDTFKQLIIRNGYRLCRDEDSEWSIFKDIINIHFQQNKDKIRVRSEMLAHKYPTITRCKVGTYRLDEVIDYPKIRDKIRTIHGKM